MSIEECARVAVAWFPESSQVTMVAIAGGESNYNPAAAGDPLRIFTPSLQNFYAPWACNDMLSFGYWQVFLGVHHAMIQTMSGASTPCEMAAWLSNPDNNGRAAAAVLVNQGFDAWTVYQNGNYHGFMEQARQAVDAARATAAKPPLPAPLLPAYFPRRVTLKFTTGDPITLDISAVQWGAEGWALHVLDDSPF